MAYTLPGRITSLSPYEPISGEYDIRLDANESFIKLPKKLLKNISKEVLGVCSNRYPDPVCKRICSVYGKLYGINPESITAGNGSDEIISLVIGTFFDEGDELLTLSNDFSMYRIYAETYGVKVSVLDKNDDLTVNVDSIIEYMKKNKTKGVVFSNPCNPTSLCLAKEEVLRLTESLPDSLCIIDEAYMDFSDQSVLDYIEKYDNLLVLKTASKAIGLASIRLGFAIASEKITNALKSVKSPYNVNSITQAVGIAVLSDKEYIIKCREKIIAAREELYKMLLDLSDKFEKIYKPQTNFVYIKTAKAAEIFEELKKRSIVIRNMGGYLRITAGSHNENKAVFAALKEILK